MAPRQYPKLVILDLSEHIKDFHERTAEMNDYEWCIDEMLDLIISYLRYSNSAELGLDALVADVETCFERDGVIVAKAVAELGNAVLRLLLQFKIYSDDGVLHYRFSKQWCDFLTPVFVRIDEGVT